MESSVDEVKKAIDKAIAIETPKLQNWQTLKVDVQFVNDNDSVILNHQQDFDVCQEGIYF